MTSYFQQNVDRWAILYPDVAKEVMNLTPGRWRTTRTTKDELNLAEVSGAKKILHSNEGAVQEASEWFKSLQLDNVSVIYVYGVGLGYYYEAAKSWLSDQKHFLVFLEDDLEVIYHLFHTELAAQILQNKQVRIQHFFLHDMTHKVWQRLAVVFMLKNYLISSLDCYLKDYPDRYEGIRSNLAFFSNVFNAIQPEFDGFGYVFYNNMYQNLLKVPESFQASGLFGKFNGVPAIICGAGPSLDKNLSLLETLGNRALIFAGGTAMNAVNSRGFIPHFGVGIDPNETHYARLLMNTAFEVPYIYRCRIFSPILDLVQGMKIYVNKAGGHATPEWFENRLGIENPVSILEGMNVINFSLSLAYAMGCNPIIFVGMDLSYPENKSYQSGVESHAVHTRRHDFRTKTEEEELISRADIFGNPVLTLWKWVSESGWISKFAAEHPGALFINSTEGGIGMPGIPNLPLSEVAANFFIRMFDFRVRIQGELQNYRMPEGVTIGKIMELFNEMRESLIRCKTYCIAIFENLHKSVEYERVSHDHSAEDFIKEEREAILSKLKEEDAFKYILNDFNEHYEQGMELDIEQIKYDPSLDESSRVSQKSLMDAIRFYKLSEAAAFQDSLLNMCVQKYQSQQLADVDVENFENENRNYIYSFENQIVKIDDPELGLFIQEQKPSDLVSDCLFYPSEAIKMEQYLTRNHLHGPVTFYSEKGGILAQSWYVNGVQEGKAWYYYLNGQLYCVQNFVHGHLHGPQRYYYPDGRKRTNSNYNQGQVDGDVMMFYPSGVKKRELHFKKGKRHGVERLWGPNGLLLLEVEYFEGRPVNQAKKWHSNGQLALQILYDDKSQLLTIREWDEFGVEIPQNAKDDFVDSLVIQINLLTNCIDNVYEHLSKITPLLVQESEELNKTTEDFKLLAKEISGLKKIGEELLLESGLQPDRSYEPIWKSATLRQELQKQLQVITEKLKKEMAKLERVVSHAVQKHLEK